MSGVYYLNQSPAVLRSSLAKDLSQSGLGAILNPQTPAEAAAGVTPSALQYFGQPWLWVRREGCVLDGTTDDTVAFNKCLSVAAALSAPNFALLIDGPCYLNSNITIPQNVQLWFVGGGKLKPGSGHTITLGQNPQAGLWQIFDLSSGGLIAIPSTGNRIQELWAEWWGANGDAVSNLANDVPINAAMACMLAAGNCGVVRLGSGTFFISAVINIPTLVSLRGMGYYTLIKAKSGWSGGTRLIAATNGTSPMFDSRLESVRVDANGFGSITQMIYGTGWQQRCGIFNSTLANFQADGFYYEHGYGGAAFMELSHIDFFPNDVANARGAFITNDGTTGFMKLMLKQISTVNAGGNTQSVSGVQIDNQILGVVDAFDIEAIHQGILLSKGAVLTGSGISGGTAVTAMINCGASWTGQIDCGSVKIGNATAVIVDANRTYAIAAVESIDGHLIWPPNPGKAVAAATITGAATPVIASGVGISAVAHQAAGQQRLTMTTSMDGLGSYDVECSSGDTSAPMICYQKVSATQFDIFTRSGANVATDSGEFKVQVFHRP